MFYSRPKLRDKRKKQSNSNFNNRPDNIPLSNENESEHFLPGPSKESDKKASTEITKQLQRESEDVFTDIGCFDRMISLQVKLDSKPYHAPHGA